MTNSRALSKLIAARALAEKEGDQASVEKYDKRIDELLAEDRGIVMRRMAENELRPHKGHYPVRQTLN